MDNHTGSAPGYIAYLLRLWRGTRNGKVVWQASLECPHSGQVLGFANLEALCAFLYTRTAGGTGHTPEEEENW